MAKQEEKKVKGNDPVTIYATAKAVFIPEGDAFEVHSNQAEILIKAGKATKDAPKGKASE